MAGRPEGKSNLCADCQLPEVLALLVPKELPNSLPAIGGNLKP